MSDPEWDRISTLGTFLDEPEEVHSFAAGMYSAWYGFPSADFIGGLPQHLQDEIELEYAYFIGGRIAARIVRWLVPVLDALRDLGVWRVRKKIES